MRVLRQLAYYGKLAAEIIYPRRCSVCGVVIDEGCFCSKCRQSFLLLKKSTSCEQLDGVFCLYKYKAQLLDIIHQIKFSDNAALLPLLAEEAALALPRNLRYFIEEFDVITSVPTSAERRKRRGFDVPQEIFTVLRGAKWSDDILIRARNTAPLFGLEPASRREELHGCFQACGDVRGKRILLCDDIFTTGSTANEAAQVLRLAGAAGVTALAFTASKDNWRED